MRPRRGLKAQHQGKDVMPCSQVWAVNQDKSSWLKNPIDLGSNLPSFNQMLEDVKGSNNIHRVRSQR